MLWIILFSFISAFLIWLLISSLYKPIGTIAKKITKDAMDNLNDNENEDKKDEDEK